MLKFTTAQGTTIEATRVGVEYDMHVRAADGRTIATVRMGEAEAWALLDNAGEN